MRSNPPRQPVDQNTDELPKFWRGQDVAFQIGIFDPFGFPVNLANLDFLEVDIFPYPLPPLAIPTNKTYAPYTRLPFPTTPPAPLLSVTIPKEDITPLITTRGWCEQLEQHAEAIFTWIDTASLSIGGRNSRKFTFVVHGMAKQMKFFADEGVPLTDNAGIDVTDNAGTAVTSGGSLTFYRRLTYGGGILEVFESDAQGIYLPNMVAPLSVPESTILLVQENTQLTFAVQIVVDGQMLLDGALVDINSRSFLPTVPVTDNFGVAVTDNAGSIVNSN